MAEDQTPDPADQPEEDKTPPADNPPEPYRLGGSGRSGKGPEGASGQGGEPGNPFEAFLSSLAGGDMNALAAQLQNAFAMLGGAGSMFTSGQPDTGSGVNWEVTKDTARKLAASLGPDPSPDAGQQRAITEAVELAELWLDEATTFPRVSSTVAAWSRADWIEQTMPVWQRLVEPVAMHIADAMEGALNFGGSEEAGGMPGIAGMEQMLRPMLRTSGASMFGLQLGQGQVSRRRGRGRHGYRSTAQRARARRIAAHQRQGIWRRSGTVELLTSRSIWPCENALGSDSSPPRAGCEHRCSPWLSSTRVASPSTPPR